MRRAGALVAALVAVAGLTASPPAAQAAGPDVPCGQKPEYSEKAPSVLSALAMPDAWKLSLGKSVVVAVVDSGVDPKNNPHLKDAVIAGRDFVDVRGDGTTDTYGHGTAVAGLIAARLVKGSGLVGIAPEATILPVRVYGGSCHDREAPTIDPGLLAQGIEWAADQRAQIVVVAASTSTPDSGLNQAVAHATSRGSLVVAAAGNAGDPGAPSAGGDPAASQNQDRYPASSPGALSVTAVDANGLPSADVVRSIHIGIAAPGQAVMTTLPGGGDYILSSDKASTSYATAYVAGVAALVASIYPQDKPSQWVDRMLATASRPQSIQGADNVPKVGWGIVAPYAALNLADVAAAPGPANPTAPSRQVPPPPVIPDPGPNMTGVLAGIVGPMAGATVVVFVVISLLKTRRNVAGP